MWKEHPQYKMREGERQSIFAELLAFVQAFDISYYLEKTII